MKGVKPIILPRKVARKKWKEYVEASKIHGDKYIKELKGLYYHLKEDRKVIDIFEAFKFAGLNDKDEPKLAICRANEKTVIFEKESNGRGFFKPDRWNYKSKEIVSLPVNTYKNFPLIAGSRWEIINSKIRTKVPIIPPNALPKKGKLSDYFILWEVDYWENVPRDPFLLKRISNNLFVIISHWNLTKLERALINGR